MIIHAYTTPIPVDWGVFIAMAVMIETVLFTDADPIVLNDSDRSKFELKDDDDE
jgi:CRISPR/Cas system-associated exonuclease Cas4 (RecB family)